MSDLNVLLVDDHSVVRMGFKMLIDSEKDMQVIAEAETGEEGIIKFQEIKPDVISISAGFTRANGEMHSIIKELYSLGIPVVCAAGNGGKRQGVIWPAKYPETIAVGAFDPQGNVPHFSAKGKLLDFSAPGVSIMSTWIQGKYAELSGTSMACPFIAGAVALLISKHKKLLESGLDDSINSVEKIKTSLIECSNDMGPIGKDKEWGFGVIDFNKIKNF